MRLRWHPEALEDLRGIHDYIARDNPEAARRVVTTIRSEADTLRHSPSIGRPGRVPGSRELVITRYPYILAYRVRGDAVEALAVVHTWRRWPDSLPNK